MTSVVLGQVVRVVVPLLHGDEGELGAVTATTETTSPYCAVPVCSSTTVARANRPTRTSSVAVHDLVPRCR